jgi:fibro-slime domain-containing protein
VTRFRESGNSGRALLYAVACAALAATLGCAGTKVNEGAAGSGGGAGALAGQGGGGAGGSAGGVGTAGSNNPFDTHDAGDDTSTSTSTDAAANVDACAGDACGADVAEQQAVCGDGKLGGTEQCDDKNAVGGDGCSASCQQEADFACPAPGEKCVSTVKCNDRKVTGNEQCDDGNNAAGDGCSPTCTLECGWTCTVGGGCRAAKCGDGKVAGNEQCDDGNATAGDGCSPTCALESKPITVAEGWACTSPKMAANGCVGPTTCTTTVCGNKTKEGSEQCDDGNPLTGDGCSPFCRLEPVCPGTGGACTTACGDGLLLPVDKAAGQECDDGNTVSGDGCSSTCKKEKGFVCTDVSTKPDKLVLPVVYHDFKGWNEGDAAHDHPDFQHYPGNGRGFAGIAQATLGPAGVPVHVAGCYPTAGAGYPAILTANNCPQSGTAAPAWDATVDWFGKWYVDDPTFNKTIVQTLTLAPIAGGAFQYTDLSFFPIDGLGWGNTPNYTHNYGFTSVARTWFEYTGTATLTFYGDDDVWVYVNKKLAVDLGGTHQQATGSVTLDATNGHGYVCDFVAPGNAYPSPACSAALANGHDVDLGLVIGGVYEIDVFQAERYTTESNYQLTLSGFTGIKSSCVGACGDGVVTAPESCDLGTAKNTGAYGTCNADCSLAPECGDGKVQTPPEECDDGVNLATYNATKKCGPGCKWASHCGDGMVDGMYEQCDQGADNGKGYGFCAIDCKLGPRCGDGIVQKDAGEECDLNTGACDNKCKTIILP